MSYFMKKCKRTADRYDMRSVTVYYDRNVWEYTWFGEIKNSDKKMIELFNGNNTIFDLKPE